MIHGSAGPKANELPPCYLSDAVQDAGDQQCDDDQAAEDEAKKAPSQFHDSSCLQGCSQESSTTSRGARSARNGVETIH
jgi:hypothetical protein